VAHPFAAALVPLTVVRDLLGGGEQEIARVRDVYLGAFEVPAGEDLVQTLEVACQVAKVARVLTWARATDAVRQAGEAVDEQFATAPRQSLAALQDDTYLGRA
jgi:hypothetical protein